MSEQPQESKAVVSYGNTGVQLKTLDDAWRMAKAIAASGWAPKGMDRPEAILVALQFGAELGLTPMSALQSLAVINGRPSIYGDAALALVRGSGLLETYAQDIVGDGDKRAAVVSIKRRGEDVQEHRFSVADAKRAGLWGKQGPWTQYPDRMLLFRARGFALRDAFGDVLKGLRTFEEARDIPPAIDMELHGNVAAPRPIRRGPTTETVEAAGGTAEPVHGAPDNSVTPTPPAPPVADDTPPLPFDPPEETRQ